MKTPDQQPDQIKQFKFYRECPKLSPTNKSNSNYLCQQYNHKPVISKLEINFPKIKICESRKCLTEQSISSQTQEHIVFPFNCFNNKEKFTDNQNFLGANLMNQKNNNEKNNVNSQMMSDKISYEKYDHKKERSPVRLNEYSYQETTKEDYQQNNTPSYNEFFKAPIQLNSMQNGQNNAFIPSVKEFDSKKDFYQRKYEDHLIKEAREGYYSFQDNQRTIKDIKWQPTELKAKPKQYNIQEPIKQKGNMTLSQLLIDLQRRSQKLYQIYGQNNEDYQKCLDTMEKHQKSCLLNNQPSIFDETVKQKDQKESKHQNCSWKKQNDKFESSYGQQYDFNKTFNDKKEETFNFLDQKIYQRSANPHIKIQDSSNDQQKQRLICKKNSQEVLNYASIKQKSFLDVDKSQQSSNKKPLLNSQFGPTIPTMKGIISTSKSLSKEPSLLQKKKKVMFYQQEDHEKYSKEQKASKFAIYLLRFFNKFLLNLLRSNYFYQTGFLSTESNIHATSGRNVEENQDRSRDTKETSFFQEYLERREKISSQDILCNMMGEGVRKINIKKGQKETMALPYPLLPIEEQIESSYGMSMIGSSQKKKMASMRDEDQYLEKNQKSKFQRKKNEQNTDSRFNQHINTLESRKVEELLIQSVDKTVFKNQLNSKKQPSQTQKQIDPKNFVYGLDKISQILKYKVLTNLRSAYLILKFLNPRISEKGGISWLKLSEVSKKSMKENQKNNQNPKVLSNMMVNKEQQVGERQNTNIQPSSSVTPNLYLQSVNKDSKIKSSQIHEPTNILEHYYKKSSPNSQTNQYASIIQEQRQQVQIRRQRVESGSQNQRFAKNMIVTPQPFTKMKQSQLFPLSPNYQMSTLQQDYYHVTSQNNQPLPSNLSLPRTSRALSSSSSKVTINYGTIPLNQQIPNSYQRITKESLLGMRRSDLPIYSPKHTESNLGRNLQQFQNIDKKDNQKQVQCPILPNFNVQQFQQFHTSQTSNQQFDPLPTIRPFQLSFNQLDSLSLKGKISRSYSQNDFKNYYNHNVQNSINLISPVNVNLKDMRSSQMPGLIKGPIEYNRPRVETILESQNEREGKRINAEFQSNMKNSTIKNGHLMMKSSNLMPSRIPIYPLNQTRLHSPSNNFLSISQTNQQTIGSAISNTRTIRPLLNPSMQKRRSQSMGLFLEEPNFVNSFDQVPVKSSMFKQLEAKPYIQFKHPNKVQQQPHYLASNCFHNANIQHPIHHNQVPFNGQKLDNRPRVSKSVDQCIMRSSSLSGYQGCQSSVGMYPIHNFIPLSNQPQSIIPSHNIPKTIHADQPFNRPTSNLISPNQYITNPSIPKNQVQVDSEYHLMKTNFQLKTDYGAQNLNSKNVNPSIHTLTNQSNQVMKESFVKGSRIKYEQQNLIVGNGINAISSNTNNQINQYKSSQQYSTQQTHNFTQSHAKSPILPAPLFKSKIKLTKSPTNASVKPQTNNQFGTYKIPKTKSPQMITKSKSPEAIKIKNTIAKSKESLLRNYGQN